MTTGFKLAFLACWFLASSGSVAGICAHPDEYTPYLLGMVIAGSMAALCYMWPTIFSARPSPRKRVRGCGATGSRGPFDERLGEQCDEGHASERVGVIPPERAPQTVYASKEPEGPLFKTTDDEKTPPTEI
jgi:hypothetical protein